LAPKYRLKIFYNKRVKKDCESIFKNICAEKGYRIHAMEVVEDHVHLFLEFHPSTSLSKVIQNLKGGSFYRLFKLHPELREKYWDGSLWLSGKFYRSIGNITGPNTSEAVTGGKVDDTKSQLALYLLFSITKNRIF
jgi:putative transposase